MASARPEAAIQRAILDYLTLRGVPHTRVNSGAWLIGEGSARRMIRGASAGTADILACLPGGRFAAIEVKAGRNKATPAQDEFLSAIERAGGLAMIAYSVEDVVAVIEPLIASRGGPVDIVTQEVVK